MQCQMSFTNDGSIDVISRIVSCKYEYSAVIILIFCNDAERRHVIMQLIAY